MLGDSAKNGIYRRSNANGKWVGCEF